MANYIENSLEEGERIIFNGRLHWTAIARYLITAWVLALGGVAVMLWTLWSTRSEYLWTGGVALLVAFVVYVVGSIVRTRSEFAVTTSRFIQKDGIFNIKMTEIPLFKVETINFSQTLFQRMLGTGCIELVGSGGTSHSLHSIEHPMELRKVLMSVIKNSEASAKE